MTAKVPRARRRGGADDSDASQTAPTLPPWKAFVVQFSHQTGADAGVFAGRVEHLNSGRRARFASAEELIETLTGFLEDVASSE